MQKIIRPYTLVGFDPLHNLYALAERIDREQIPGDVVECGVYKGGSAAVLARVATHSRMRRTVWLFDSFQGLPPAAQIDGEKAVEHVGTLTANPEEVQELLRKTGADLRRVRVVPGFFQDTFSTVEIPRIALLNIDADWYDSVKLCLERFYDCVVPGGFISFDDYGYWPGCKAAVDEFFSQRGLTCELQAVDANVRWFQKPDGTAHRSSRSL
jgi:O-methyltransferase